MIHDHDLAWIDFGNVFCIDDVERTSFRGDHECTLFSSKSKRTPAVGIARSNELILGEDHETVGTLDLLQSISSLFYLVLRPTPCNQMENDLRIGCGLKNRAFVLKTLPQCSVVGEISVVRNREVSTSVGDS